ncbi:MAG: amidohydrolase family protein, partial [Chloroflexi bacterium]|nr:amidohydrolase family protein [Chloroflexota bacterium]
MRTDVNYVRQTLSLQRGSRMTTAVDLVVYGARQLLTLAGKGTRRGAASGELGLVADGAVAISAGQIVAVGTTSEVLQSYRAPREIDAGGRVVLPGFIDAHTHPVFAGSRQDEFERRIAGATYLEIMAAGGGIMSTVRATRQASLEQLVGDALPRLRRMLAHGTTTADAKTGYGLTTADELKCLETIRILGKRQPIELLPTFLGAHAVPEEHAGRADAYVELVVEEMLPAAAEQHARSAGHEASAWQPLACDVFCDEGAFNLEQTRRILVAAKDLGMTLKLHADEFASLGAARLA